MKTENVVITSGAWGAVTVTPIDSVTSYTVRARSGADFLLSSYADGSEYFTVSGVLTVDDIRNSTSNMFYAKSTIASDTLELILFS